MKKNLKGLLLVGGKSSRMGTSKAQIIYRDGVSEWLRIRQLMQSFCDEVFVCCQESQAQEFDCPVILDQGNGPLAAIAEAGKADSSTGWLVIACDLPLLDSDTIENLVQSRAPESIATYYKSALDGKPEPLCAIYEKDFFPIIQQSLKNGQFCPRGLLLQKNGTPLSLKNPQALKNANTPAEKLEVEAILAKSTIMKLVNIRYFAQLREIAQIDAEELETSSVTPAGLYEELQAKYKFPHKPKQLMVAVNDDFSGWDTKLSSGDEIVFIPPVAGG